MMFFDGYIGAPPTLTVASADAGTTVAAEVNASAATAAAANRLRCLDIMFSSRGWKQAATPPGGRDDRDDGPRVSRQTAAISSSRRATGGLRGGFAACAISRSRDAVMIMRRVARA